MVNFVLRNYTDMIYGKDQETKTAKLIKDFGGTRVLIHHSGEDFVLELIERVKGYLDEEGLAWVELSGVVPNPHIELVYEGIALCRKENVDFILAIGGGSVIDSAKAIGIGTLYEGDVWDIYEGRDRQKRSLPVGVISTFAGTGSEATFGSVITKGKIKHGIEDPDDFVLIRPKFVIMNPEITYTVPKFQTAVGIADMLTHLTENFFTADPDNDLSDHLACAGIRTVLKFAPVVMQDPCNYEARGVLMVLSPLAINGIMKVGRWGDWGCHDIEHEMSGEWNISHGAGLAILMPVWMRYVYKDHMKSFIKFAVEMFRIPLDVDEPEKTALAGIRAYEDFLYNMLGLPSSLSALGIPPEELGEEVIHKVAEQVFYRGNETTGRTHPLRKADVVRILRQCTGLI
ncbi:iron-containing alcohol dehydrogenase [[Clostridium] symbiosum]|uniref:iron-containing alcohol dehydrogenase n=1 Tax=Clostridium symbiosum TaxID=1512 RepID=UPI001D06FCA2|nr:iron-containing alcohol dehydrogenase [[Clostridium] symbiosum]MCB6608286.1 iron-containing alcohol dehydrogenase [[Clostridium] symbiosum]MCB6932836.1 iron-containing alcohol dehydrogenase [[Clostridium] symbiosum]